MTLNAKGALPGIRSLGDGQCSPFAHVRMLRAARQAAGTAIGWDAVGRAWAEAEDAEREAKEWAERLRRRVDEYARLYDAEPHVPTPVAQSPVVGELQRFKAAVFDVEQVLSEFLGVPASSVPAWEVVRVLVDVYAMAEHLRTSRRKADGTPHARRPVAEACRRCGVSERRVWRLINRARRRARRNGR